MFIVGQKVNLWQVHIDFTTQITRILKSVIVTITEEKIGVPGEWSGEPSTLQSLKGIGNDGLEYLKHWNRWPETQTSSFGTVWTHRIDGCNHDGSPGKLSWIPTEAPYAYWDYKSHGRPKGYKLIGPDGKDILPQGDVRHCMTHDEYFHNWSECFECSMAAIKAA